MNTLIVTMTLDPARSGDVDRHLRDDVAAWAKTLPGFVTGSWLRSEDSCTGLGVVTFTSPETAAAAAVGPRSAPPGPAWSIDSVEIYEQVERV